MNARPGTPVPSARRSGACAWGCTWGLSVGPRTVRSIHVRSVARRAKVTSMDSIRTACASVVLVMTACGTGARSGDGGAADRAPVPLDASADASIDAPADADAVDDAVASPDARSNIRHVVLISQENHTFDTYFGRYCTAPAGSNPTCNDGPACCERAPDADPMGHAPVTLDDAANANYDPNHAQDCERAEINGGAMDRFAAGAPFVGVAPCSDARNVAIASTSLLAPYHQLASMYALADRYFQPIVGSTSANDMYFAVAQKQFIDNQFFPDAIGTGCTLGLVSARVRYTGRTTIADLLLAAGETFGVYAEGYAAMRNSNGGFPPCPSRPGDCTGTGAGYLAVCYYDPSDVPFEYYAQFTDNPMYMHDLADLATDVSRRSLPSFSYVKHAAYHNEHPGYGNTISNGVSHVQAVIDLISASPYADDTLILVTWDEGGGFFDHIAPPGPLFDGESRGTRVPLLVVGRFARRNFVSHVELEHSSIVRFLEFNFLGSTGQLNARDALVNNLGSLLDPAQTGIVVP